MPTPHKKPISRKQLAANRRNAKKSCGPRSAAGRQTVSRNAVKHGLAGRFALLPHENPAAHEAFCREFIDHFAPANATELNLAQTIANDLWRLDRTINLENTLFAKAALGIAPDPGPERDRQIADADARTFLNHADTLLLVSLYEQRLNCAIHKNTARLRLLQTERRQVILESQLIEIPYSIPVNRLAAITDQNGFVYANNFPAPYRRSPLTTESRSLKASPPCYTNQSFK
jgi:hypothetical protein